MIASGNKIKFKKFDTYSYETAKIYVNIYGWYPMSPTVHKILIHGSTIIDKAILPIGQLSKEASEVRNKYLRQYREQFSRKFSRVQCNTDILNRLLLNSDPYFSNMRRMHNKVHKKNFTRGFEINGIKL